MNGTSQNEDKNTKNDGDKKDKRNLRPVHCLSKNSLDQNFHTRISREKEKDITVYRSNHHANKAFDNLHELLKTSTLNDVMLVTEDGLEVPAHKIILMACSPYFRAMFGRFGEREENRVMLNGIDHAILQLLVKFMYSTEIHINEGNVQSLLAAANFLQLTIVVEACCDFLLKQLHPSNVLGIRALADQHDCHELIVQTDGYIEHYFLDVIKEEEFFALSSQELIRCISNNYLAVPSEQSIFDCVISWIYHDVEKRKEYLAQLMEQVRLPLISHTYLMEVVGEEPLLKSNPQTKDYFIEALKYHVLRLTNGPLFETRRTKPRQPYELPKLMVVVGGISSKSAKSVECYDFRDNKWHEFPNFSKSLFKGGLTVFDGRIYAMGGGSLNDSLSQRTVNVYEPHTGEWLSCTEMIKRRRNFGVVTLDNRIYAIGGRNKDIILNSAEVYDPKTDRWKLIAPMSTTREYFAVSALNDRIYVVGGYGGELYCNLSTIECYNPLVDQWAYVFTMKVPRRQASADSINGILYIVGGYSDIGISKRVVAFNPKTNKETYIKDMPEARYDVGVIAVHGKLYVIGGNNGTVDLTSVCVYYPGSDTWNVLLNSMNIGRSHAGVAVIDKPHNYV